MFSKLFLKYCSLALLINLQTSFLARLKVAQSTGLSEILAFFSCLSLFFMASLISVVNQFGWFLFFQSFLFHRYLRIKNDSKNLYQLSTISSVSSKALSHGASLNFWASRYSDILCLYTRTKMVVSFANIFMAENETKLNQQSETKPRK